MRNFLQSTGERKRRENVGVKHNLPQQSLRIGGQVEGNNYLHCGAVPIPLTVPVFIFAFGFRAFVVESVASADYPHKTIPVCRWKIYYIVLPVPVFIFASGVCC
jgi:hypothetical protein